MKQKAITLKEFIKTLNIPSKQYVVRNIPENFNELDWSRKFRIFNEQHPCDFVHTLKISDNVVYYGVSQTMLHRVGNKIFRKSNSPYTFVYIEPNRINIKGIEAVLKLLEVCGINWFRDIPLEVISRYFIKSSVLRALLTRKIYSEETLYKFIGSKIFCLKGVSWRSIKKYCEVVIKRGVSVFDLYCFTKNFDQSINAICDKRSTCNSIEFLDLISYAAQLNEKVDLLWSPARMRQEHQRQISICKEKEISEKAEVPIFDNVIGGEHIKLLNTEKDIFFEGDTMHHCLYRCYYKKILRKEYIAFHMYAPEDCTFSVARVDNKVYLDQIYLKYDQRVQDSTKQIAEEFIIDNKFQLLAMFNERSNFCSVLDPFDRDNIALPF